MVNNPVKYEVLIKQYLRSILDISALNLTIFKLSQQDPTCCNRVQQGGQTCTKCCGQQCCERLAGA